MVPARMVLQGLRIAVELFAHAIAYYAAALLNSISRVIGINIRVFQTIMKEAWDLNVNNDDSKAWAYYMVWYGARLIKMHLPKSILWFFVL